MSMDQLEIITADGQVEFYALDPDKGITNIGQHPDNDIVIDEPNVASFYAMIDHRQKPYQLILFVPPHETRTLRNWDRITLGGYQLILIERQSNGAVSQAVDRSSSTAVAVPSPGYGRGGISSPASTPSPAPPIRSPGQYDEEGVPSPPSSAPQGNVSPPATRPEELNGNGSQETAGEIRTVGYFSSLPRDHTDEVIITTLADHEWIVDVEQTAVYELTIINGGPIVASFTVQVQGLDEEWFNISEPYLNLNEGDRQTITVEVTPPRLSTSWAGAHYFAIVVSSPNYTDRFSQRGAVLTVNPFYEFHVGELSPKQQTISYRQDSGKTTFPIGNMGNSQVMFRVEAEDDERACHFEFDIPGESVSLAKQAEIYLAPEETIYIPLRISPTSRRLIGVRKRTYSFTVTATPTEGQQTPRSMLGELSRKPLLGPWIIILTAIISMLICAWFVQPELNKFMFVDGGVSRAVSNGTPVAVQWEASFFTTDLTLDPPIVGLEPPIPFQGTAVVYPKTETTYHLAGSNPLSRLIPSLFAPPTKSVHVDVTPVAPIVTFEASPAQIVGEGEVELSWNVQQASYIKLYRQIGEGGSLEEIGDFSNQLVNAVRVTPEPGESKTIYVLETKNEYVLTPTPAPRQVSLVTATPTSPPPPEIVYFSANPYTINEGEEAVLSWQVSEVEQVTLQDPDSIQSVQAPAGNLNVQPQDSGEYVLIPGGGAAPQSLDITVIPATPTPTATPEPDAPTIKFFTANPVEVVKDDNEDVILKWTVVGTTTNVELSGSALPNSLSNQSTNGTYTIKLNDNATFVLTAYNDTAKSSASVQIEAVEPTPTPTITPSSTPAPTATPTATPLPTPNITNFEAFTTDANSKLIYLGAESGAKVNVYEVVAGSDVQLKWNVGNDPQEVTLTNTASGSFPNRSASESGFSDPALSPITQKPELRYTLSADKKTEYEIIFKVTDQEPPPAPVKFAYKGTTFSWNYDPSSFGEIIGFRIYRTNIPTGDPPEIYKDEVDLPVTFDGNGNVTGVKRDWNIKDDTTTFQCNDLYFIVAVYQDISDLSRKETNAASDSLFIPCPAP